MIDRSTPAPGPDRQRPSAGEGAGNPSIDFPMVALGASSKEELQSLNEELTALNSQLHVTVEQQRPTANDLQNILNSTDVATLFLDRDLKIRFFTPAAMSLFNVIASDIGRPLADFTRRFKDDELLSDALAVLESLTAVRREVKDADGGWFIRSMLPYRSDGNTVHGVVITFSSISEIKAVGLSLEAAKSAAERANLGKSRFLAAASHDLRQPLQTISLLQGILAKRVHDEPTLKIIRRLEETVDTMSGMLDKLLDINQLEAGIVEPAVVDFPIARILDSLRIEFSHHTVTSGLGWRAIGSSALVRSDPRLLEQIIRNLLSNAVKYTLQGKILLGCRRRVDRLRIEVWDSGLGIPELELRSIVEEFHQLDNPARKHSKGLGLGLTIVQRLADLLAHKIDMRSRDGIGSVFSIEVPLAQSLVPLPPPRKRKLLVEAMAAAGPATPPPPAHREDAGSPTIYVIDDDQTIRETMRDLLVSKGYNVEIFADGTAFFDACKFRPGCVLVDALMPKMSGLEIIARLRAAGRTIPAIVITGHGDVGMAVKAMKAGAVDFIEKPAGADELLASVAHALSSLHEELVESGTDTAAETSLARLTARQRQILDLVLEGLPSKNIAADLGISQRTVDNHRAAIMKKTGSKTLSALIRTAIVAASISHA